MVQPPPLPPPNPPSPSGRAGPPRLPRTYTVGHERDANPRIGRAVFVALAVVCLGLQGAEFLFLPHANVPRLLAAAVRVAASWACFIAVAAGLGVARWPLAVLHVGLGLWLLVHAMMGTFANAYPALSAGTSLVPALLGLLFVGAGGWFGLSADLTAYLDRDEQRSDRMTTGSRLVTAAVLAVALGLPAAGFGLWAGLTFRQVEETRLVNRSDLYPAPPQNDEGGRFALDLVQRAFDAKDFGVFTAAMSPELKAQTKPEWTKQMSANLARRGKPLGFELADVFFNRTLEGERELTFCNVYALYEDGKLCFHCNLSRATGTKDWQVDMVFIE